MNLKKILDNRFKITEKGGTVTREIIAGLTTFATMAYILAVQPGAMVGFGADSLVDVNGVVITKEACMIMCAFISGIITLFMAFYANLPFALSTGMGSNLMFGAIIQTGEISFGGAMAITFVSGVIFVVLTACGVRDFIVKMIPKSLKIGIGTSIGFFIAYLGFKNSGIGSFENGISIGNFSNPSVLLALFGLFFIAALEAHKIKGGILIGIFGTTVLGLFITMPNVDGVATAITQIPQIISMPNISEVKNIVFDLNFAEILTWAAMPLIFITFCGDFFSTLGTILGVAGRVNMLDENGNLPNINKPFLVDAVGTTVGSVFGCTTITTFVESASGVESGGRTGLTSVVVSLLFFVSMFLSPLFISIPNAATGPALIYIGFLLIQGFKDIDFSDFTECFAPFIMLIFTGFAGGMSVGISMGILSYIFIKTVTFRFKEVHIGMYVLAIPLIMYFIVNANV